MAKRVLISGASIAGPALGFWLGRAGYDVTVVERAPKLREGGYCVDFRGPAHLGVLDRMGIIPALREVETRGGAMRFVDQRGRTRMALPAEFAGGELEARRADISRIIVEHTSGEVEWRFGESIAAISQSPEQVEVTFEGGDRRSYDFVFGCDGIHSNVRRLAFGAETEFEDFLGYYIASWDIPGLAADADASVLCNAPGRMIGTTPPGRDGTPPGVMAIFASPELDYSRRDIARHKATLRRVFAGMGWRVPELLASLERTDDVFINTISRARVPDWSTGRVALLGDASGGTSIGGMGTGTAIVGAYILAGELTAKPNDHAAAFARYQTRAAPFAAACSKNGEGSGKFLAPKTAAGLFVRNAMFSFPSVKQWMIDLANESGADIELPDYPALHALAPAVKSASFAP
jgi:2-polyprenyl-6-methoxyphenol hydroxylase-like FAD-dependent oxidoreductase